MTIHHISFPRLPVPKPCARPPLRNPPPLPPGGASSPTPFPPSPTLPSPSARHCRRCCTALACDNAPFPSTSRDSAQKSMSDNASTSSKGRSDWRQMSQRESIVAVRPMVCLGAVLLKEKGVGRRASERIAPLPVRQKTADVDIRIPPSEPTGETVSPMMNPRRDRI